MATKLIAADESILIKIVPMDHDNLQNTVDEMKRRDHRLPARFTITSIRVVEIVIKSWAVCAIKSCHT